jgi:integrase/recombinase XerD
MATAFRSPLAHRLQAFWEARFAGGQRGFATYRLLRYLDQFLADELHPGDTITHDVVQRWTRSIEHLSAGSRVNRISALRQFCLYLRYFDSRTCLIPPAFLPKRTRSPPHIFSLGEIRRIMAAAQRIGPPGSLQPTVTTTLIGLLFSTGLRVGEAVKLTLADVDLSRHLLRIRHTKFQKSRFVPLSLSTARHLAAYLRHRRQAGFPSDSSSLVFVSLRGRPLSGNNFYNRFLALLRQLGLRGPPGQRGARVHDARHTFCVHRLLAWHRSGANLFAKLPALSTYLGHASVSGTQTYLHATAELLASTGRRFHAHFMIPSSKKPGHAHR